MAEQTSAERFEDWLAVQIQHRLRLAHMRSQDEQDWARSAWMARQPEIDQLRLYNTRVAESLEKARLEIDALRQRIAELEGGREVEQQALRNALPRLVAADRLAEAMRGIGHRRPGPGETLSETFPHGAGCLGCRLDPLLAAYDEAVKLTKKLDKPA